MRFLFYTHSVVSDWNNGNAHFLRGVMRDLIARGHEPVAVEPADGWSRQNLLDDQGTDPFAAFAKDFPDIPWQTYDATFDHEAAVNAADVVVVHEWTDPALVARIGRARRNGGGFTLLFHDTHHRAVTRQGEIGALDLDDYDIILAFGAALRERYQRAGWDRQVFVWHEAADTSLFRPRPEVERSGDLVWIGNWGDGERTEELLEFLLQPAFKLGLSGEMWGVRYPDAGKSAADAARLAYRGWLANARVPEVFAGHKVTVHVPRAPYVEALPGIPTIRVFEALACGIPLVSSWWEDSEGLFRDGKDFLLVRDGAGMTRALRDVLHDPALAADLRRSGLETVQARHTCGHRVDELLEILRRNGTHRVREQLNVLEEAVS